MEKRERVDVVCVLSAKSGKTGGEEVEGKGTVKGEERVLSERIYMMAATGCVWVGSGGGRELAEEELLWSGWPWEVLTCDCECRCCGSGECL